MITIIIINIVGLLVIGGILFINLSPQFGANSTNQQKINYEKSGHYSDGVFHNQNRAKLAMNFSEMGKSLVDLIKGDPNRQPDFDLPVIILDSLDIVNNPDSLTRLTWFGHSTFLVEIDGKKILIDPMFGETPSPVPFIGTKRYSKSLPIEIEKLPTIDAVIISHDHYDHLDYESIKKLKDKVEKFYTPLAVGNHLISWGVEEAKVTELNWWDETTFKELKFVCTPAQHFSGRGLTDRNSTMWASWIIEGNQNKIYFSGDSGYGTHFKEIGDKYGPFDIALMECGQYNKRWETIHMFPEQSAQGAMELNAKTIMPIHWGAFTLALHSWTDPIERVTKKAKELELNVATPQIGESIVLGSNKLPKYNWWIKK